MQEASKRLYLFAFGALPGRDFVGDGTNHYGAQLSQSGPLRRDGSIYAETMDDDVIDRVEKAFAAAINANTAPIRLELTKSQYEELCRQYDAPEGIRMYRRRPIAIASEFRWVTQ